jgi:hypothetical protein
MEAARVGIEQLLNPFGVGRLQNEAGVMILRDTINDFGIVVSGGVGMFLPGEREMMPVDQERCPCSSTSENKTSRTLMA